MYSIVIYVAIYSSISVKMSFIKKITDCSNLWKKFRKYCHLSDFVDENIFFSWYPV